MITNVIKVKIEEAITIQEGVTLYSPITKGRGTRTKGRIHTMAIQAVIIANKGEVRATINKRIT